MAYIGNSPANTGNYQIVDDISSSFNGSLTSFALTAGSVAITPAKSGQLLVGVNGVLQEPDDSGTNGFKVSGSNIVFSSAPASGDTFWSVYQGQNVDIGTPSDDVVDTVHIKDNAITSAKIAAGAIVASDVADDSVTTAKIADYAVTADKLANSINTEIAANTAKVTNATHTGDVTGATALTIGNDKVVTAMILDDNVTADKLANSINTDIATGVTANTTANNALPKAGGTMTGDLILGDNVKLEVGSASGGDLQIYHDGTNSIITDAGDGELQLITNGTKISLKTAEGDTLAAFNRDGDSSLRYDGSKKIATTATGISVTGTAVATTDTDTSNTGSVTLDFATNQNFVLTLTGNVTLANPSTEQVGQSGFITFIQDGTGSRTVALGTDYETAGGSGLTLTSTASATDIVPYVVVASGRILLGTPQLAFA